MTHLTQIALTIDTVGFYISPSIFLTLFGSSLGAFVSNQALVVAFFAVRIRLRVVYGLIIEIVLVWILIQYSAGLSLYPGESATLFSMSSVFGAFLMGSQLSPELATLVFTNSFGGVGGHSANDGIHRRPSTSDCWIARL